MQKKYIFFLCCSLFLLQTGCYKNYDLAKKEYYFLRGVFINGYPPLFRMFKNSINNETEVNIMDVDLELSDDKGKKETMLNGQSLTMVTEANTEYTIRWKLRNSNNWHSCKKRSISPDTSQIKNANVAFDDDLYLKTTNNFPNSVFFSAFKINYKDSSTNNTPSKFAELTGMLNRTVERQLFMEAQISPNKITLYPPLVRTEYLRQNFSPCAKPFNYTIWPRYEEYSLFEMSKSDFDLLYQMNLSGYSSADALYIGEPVLFDYKKDNMLGQFFAIHPYEDIIFKNYLPKKGIVNYSILKASQPLDTNVYKTPLLMFSYGGNGDYIRPYESHAATGTLLFRDYIANNYNQKYKMSCGFFKDAYNLNLYVVYIEAATGMVVIYNVPGSYAYNYINDNLTINLP